MALNDEYYKNVLDNLYDCFYCLDQDKKIIYWNSGAEKHTGFKQLDVLGKYCWDNIFMHEDKQGNQMCNSSCPVSRTIADGRLREVDVYLHHKDGHRVPVFMRIAPIQDKYKQIIIAVEILTESSPKFEVHQKLQELQTLALLDPLTEIGNRRYTEINLKNRLEETKRYGWPFGVLFIDIDNFKNINDVYGHNIGDRVLEMVGKTMVNGIRTFDFVGRWGGEEFISILTNVNQNQLYLIANRFRSLIESSSITMETNVISVTISIGATLVQTNDTVDTLIKRADQLMYQSKASGKNCVSIY